MRLVNYLNESRTKPLDTEHVKYLLKNEFSDMAKNLLKGEVLYRGMKTKSDYSFLDPSRFKTRRSANTSNYYTLFINNHPMWEDYPKREIICSTDELYAEDYGDLHLILPENGAKIGICSDDDIWNSMNVLDLNTELELRYDITQDSYEEMKKQTQNIPYKETSMSIWDYMEKIWNPDKNNFDVTTTKNLKLPNKREVWTDAKCIVVNQDKDEELDEIVREIYGR